MVDTQSVYQAWRRHATLDPDLGVELAAMNRVQVEDAFYCDLAFGTGGSGVLSVQGRTP